MLFSQIFGIIVLLLVVTYFLFARKSLEIKAADFVIATLGVVVGLSIGALISVPLGRIEGPFGQWLPILVNVFSVAIITTYAYNQRVTITKSVARFFDTLVSATIRREASPLHDGTDVVVDTSVIIDGRILEVVRTGFFSARLILPKFVLEELQGIADSADDLRRSRGRRGLDILSELKKDKNVVIKVVEEDFPSEVDVDSKILKLARKLKARLMTVDYNLNRVAQIQNVAVLNINELNNALRPVVLPGEKLHIKLVQEGKDRTQGVGYLDDGTMVVVEGGSRLIGKEVEASVTRVFQTIAGKMIFAVPEGERERYAVSSHRR